MRAKIQHPDRQHAVARADLVYRFVIGALALLAFCAQMAGWA